MEAISSQPEYSANHDGSDQGAADRLALVEDIAFRLSQTVLPGIDPHSGYSMAEHAFIMSYLVPPPMALTAMFYGAEQALLQNLPPVLKDRNVHNVQPVLQQRLVERLQLKRFDEALLARAHRAAIAHSVEAKMACLGRTDRYAQRTTLSRWHLMPAMAQESFMARYLELSA